jgi:signal peptidase I
VGSAVTIGAAVPLSCAAVVLLVRLRHRFVAVTVEGNSMTPTFRPGDWVLVRRASLPEVHRGQVVVVAGPRGPGGPGARGGGPGQAGQGWVIKRAAAVPGEPVPAGLVARLGAGPGAVVPTGRLLVLGDNPRASVDSRTLGYLPGEDLLGVAVRRLGRAPRVGAVEPGV